jgi:ferredoxin/flavodoxin---NADP+ reductase
MVTTSQYLVAVIGAGPAGLFAARELANQNVHVFLINRDIKPGGLAEYGIYPDKHKMKEGLRAQFRQVLALDNIDYIGNVEIGEKSDLRLSDLKAMGFQAILVTAGAQGTKWLGLPGENLDGVYHAKDLVYHYNHLPPFSERHFAIGRRVAIIGAGNVMLDIAHYLSSQPQVEQIIPVVRRGPLEIKFTRNELQYVSHLLDLTDLQQELARVAPAMANIGQDPGGFNDLVQQAVARGEENLSRAHLLLRFLMSPVRILGDANGRVRGLEVEDNSLAIDNDDVKARGLHTHQTLDVDTVIFAIGDRVDDSFGLPVTGAEFVKHPNPRFPVEGNSYEVLDPVSGCPLQDIFVAGWSRKASSGLVGIARKDGTNGARAVLQYLATCQPLDVLPVEQIQARLCQIHCPPITKAEVAIIETAEHEQALAQGLEEFKFSTNQEMLEVAGLLPEGLSGSTLSRR